jgi:lysophospholipase L1-like esterase
MQQQAALVERMVGTVACLGAGAPAVGAPAFDWVSELERRPRNHELEILNFGGGGDLAQDLLRRVPDVIARAPDKVVIWTGCGDVLAGVSSSAWRRLALGRRALDAPTPAGFRETLGAIVRRLKMGTEAAIGLCSLPPIGEDPEPVTALQQTLNDRVAEYSAIIAEIAHTERCAYIPVGEALAARIDGEPGQSYPGFQVLPFCRDAVRAVALRQSPDAIGDANGWRYHTDGLHLNTRAGVIAANLVQRFLEG